MEKFKVSEKRCINTLFGMEVQRGFHYGCSSEEMADLGDACVYEVGGEGYLGQRGEHM